MTNFYSRKTKASWLKISSRLGACIQTIAEMIHDQGISVEGIVRILRRKGARFLAKKQKIGVWTSTIFSFDMEYNQNSDVQTLLVGRSNKLKSVAYFEILKTYEKSVFKTIFFNKVMLLYIKQRLALKSSKKSSGSY